MIVVVLHTFKWFSLGMVLAAVLPKCARDRLNLHRKVLSAGRVEREVALENDGKLWECSYVFRLFSHANRGK
jgi:hypothetical protein